MFGSGLRLGGSGSGGGGSSSPVPAGANLFGFGHSFLQGSLDHSADRYLTRLAGTYDMVERNFGIIGNFSAHLTYQMYNSFIRTVDPFFTQASGGAIAQTGAVIINSIENDASLGSTAIPWVNNATLATCNLIRSARRFPFGDASCAYTGTWTTEFPPAGQPVQISSDNDNHVKQTTTQNDYVEVAFTGDAISYFLVAQASGTLIGASAQVSVDGVVKETIATDQAVNSSFSCGLIGRTLRGFGAGAHTLKIKHNGAASAVLQFSGWSYPAVRPMPIIIVKGLTAYDANCPLFSATLDAIAASFPDGNVVTVNPNTGFVAGTMLGSNTHPNALGNQFYADTVIAPALEAFGTAWQANTTTVGNHLR